MAFSQISDPNWSTPTSVNPLSESIASALQTMQAGQKLQGGYYENLINKAKAQYAPQMTLAQLLTEQAKPRLSNAQADLATANAGAVPSEINLRNAQASGIPSEIALRQAQASGIPSEINLRNAQAKEAAFYSQNPLLKLSGPAGQYGALAYMQGHPDQFGGQNTGSQGGYSTGVNNALNYTPLGDQGTITAPQQQNSPQQGKSLADRLAQSLEATTDKNISTSQYDQKRTNAYAYATAPVDGKAYMIAQLAGAGYNPDDAINGLSQGKTVAQMIQEKGFDPANPPEPDFLPTKGNITQLKNRQAALSEVKYLGDKVTKGLGPYSQTFMGMSPVQISSALSGMDKEKQIDFLAARGIAPELTNLRLTLAQAKGTVSAQKEMMEKSMLGINAFRSQVTPDVWEAVQRRTDEWLSNAFTQARKSYSLGGRNEQKLTKEHVTEENIQHTLSQHPELTREQLVAKLKKKGLL